MLEDIIAILCIWNLVGFFIVGMSSHDLNLGEFLNPIDIYYNTHLNIFGCIVLTTIRNLLCPLMSIIVWICLLVYWLMTVGRK
jgi:hypothetical protein